MKQLEYNSTAHVADLKRRNIFLAITELCNVSISCPVCLVAHTNLDFAQVYVYLRNSTIYSMLNSLLQVLYDFGRPRGNFRNQFVSLGAVFPDIWLQHCCTATSSHVIEHSFYLLFWNYYKTWNAFFLGSASSAHFPGFLYFKLRSYKRKNRYFRLSTGGLQIFIF